MHLRGKDYLYRAIYPDGRSEILLSVPRYDFGWQTNYLLQEPLHLPAKTRIECTAYFDNSGKNPNNPDPASVVFWGDQTWQEMMIGFVDYALDVPMYFVKRGEHYQDVTGANFRDLLAGHFAPMPGERAVLSDWANHLSTIFPEVRLKRFLEMRGADAGPMPLLVALPALFTGLLYSTTALDAAWDLVKTWTHAQRETLRADVPAQGLAALIGGRSLRDIGRQVLTIAHAGLTERGYRDAAGRDETAHLDVLDTILGGQTEAERLIASFKGDWAESVDPAFRNCVYG